MPWSEIEALFIGGDDEFKMGPAAQELAAAARDRGKWLHVGRVNTLRRLRYCQSIGADSVDGTSWARYTRFRGQRSADGARVKLVPISIREANRYVLHHHRHNRPTQGALFALAAEKDGQQARADSALRLRRLLALRDAQGGTW